MSQITAPTIGMVKGFAGQLADSHGPKDMVTSLAVAAAIIIGKFVSVDQANGDDAVKVPATSADVTALGKGIAAHAHSQETSLAANPTWPIKSAFPTLQKGRIYVAVEDAVDEGAPVFVRFQGGNEGGFRSDVDTANAVALPGARFKSKTTGAGIAIVELNLPA